MEELLYYFYLLHMIKPQNLSTFHNVTQARCSYLIFKDI
jgi:hypothetical protein